MLAMRAAIIGLLSVQVMGFAQDKNSAAPQPVQLHAVVTDGAGKLVAGLTREDFVLTENDVEQRLESVSMVGGQGQSTPRAIVLLFDTAHTSGEALERVRVAVRRFVDEQKRAQDVVAVVTSSGKPGTSGEFSSKPESLKTEMNKTRPGSARIESFLSPVLCGKVVRRDPQAVSLASLILQSEDRFSGSVQMAASPNPEADAASKCMMVLLETQSRRKALVNSVGAAVDKVAALPGQRVIAIFTEGFSMTATGGDAAIAEVRPAISSAVRSGAMIYTFDATIPLSSKQPTIESYSLAGEILNAKLDLQHGQGLLAGQTGGDAYFNLDTIGEQLQKMLDANQVSYRLAYYPPPSADPLKFRTINIKVKGHTEYQVRAAKGYDMTAPRRK